MPLSFDHIKRCVKERELRKVATTEAIVEGKFVIFSETAGNRNLVKYFTDHDKSIRYMLMHGKEEARLKS